MFEKRFSVYRILLSLEKLSAPALMLCSLGLVAILGGIDYLSGFELSFSFFYLIPVSIAAWGVGRNAGLEVSALSAITWATSNLFAGEVYPSIFIFVWNALTRLGFFSVVTILLHTLKQVIREEQYLASTDPLTGALNSRSFYEIINTKVLKAKIHKRPYTIAYIDLDNFKQINDQKGHTVGDAALKMVVTTIQNNIRDKDFIARLGGDEFALLLIETGEMDAKRVVERLHTKLLASMQAQDWDITFSIGVLTFLASPENVNKMIGLTDQLMYQVKSQSKNAVMYSIYHDKT